MVNADLRAARLLAEAHGDVTGPLTPARTDALVGDGAAHNEAIVGKPARALARVVPQAKHARQRRVERAAAADAEAVTRRWPIALGAHALVADRDHLLPPRTDAVLLGQDGDHAALVERGGAGGVEHLEQSSQLLPVRRATASVLTPAASLMLLRAGFLGCGATATAGGSLMGATRAAADLMGAGLALTDSSPGLAASALTGAGFAGAALLVPTLIGRALVGAPLPGAVLTDTLLVATPPPFASTGSALAVVGCFTAGAFLVTSLGADLSRARAATLTLAGSGLRAFARRLGLAFTSVPR